jgi:hypothetical protein
LVLAWRDVGTAAVLFFVAMELVVKVAVAGALHDRLGAGELHATPNPSVNGKSTSQVSRNPSSGAASSRQNGLAPGNGHVELERIGRICSTTW